MADPGHYIVIPPCPDCSGTAVEGSTNYTEIKARLLTTDHRLGRPIGGTATYRPGYWCAGLWYTDRCGLWAARRMARYLYQYLAAGDAVASV